MVERKDVEAALAARKELGPEYDEQIVDAIVDRIEKRLDERGGERRPATPRHHYYDMRVALGSIALGIGATAVATSHGAGWIAVIAWIAIAVVNVAYAFRR
ncbi:MAG: hypothetical protein ACYDCH_07405 [Gaiellaceae bacterium]